MENQNSAIKKYLEAGHGLTAYTALPLFGCFRLAARVSELRRAGANIVTEWGTRNGKHWAIYHLVKREQKCVSK